MRYMLMICTDETVQPSPAEIQADAGFTAWMDELQRRDVLSGGERLRPSTDATTVRVRDGDVVTSDGPFAETKELIGGFNIIDCQDLDEAIELAAKRTCARGHRRRASLPRPPAGGGHRRRLRHRGLCAYSLRSSRWRPGTPLGAGPAPSPGRRRAAVQHLP